MEGVMIKALLFDFGRVISAQKPPALFRRYERELGLPPDTINTIMFDSVTWQEALVGRMTMDDFWQTIGPALGLSTSAAIKAFQQRYYGDETLNEEVAALIRTLSDHFRLAVLSNSPPGLARWLDDWQLLRFFDVVFCSGDEGIAKPDPRAFTLTIERLGVKPREAIFIDDTLEHVETARRLGFHGVVFTIARVLVEDLRQLLPLFRCWPQNKV
jgi:epoxide hydrolase-like predicted phosphatase